MNLVDGLDSVQVVDTRVQADLVEDGDAGILGLLVESHHGLGDVGCGDNMLLDLDGGLDDDGVEGVGNEGDDQVVLGDLLLERIRVGDVERDGASVLETLGEGFGAGEGTAGFEEVSVCYEVNESSCSMLTDGDLDAGLVELDSRGPGNEAGTEKKDLVRGHDCSDVFVCL